MDIYTFPTQPLDTLYLGIYLMSQNIHIYMRYKQDTFMVFFDNSLQSLYKIMAKYSSTHGKVVSDDNSLYQCVM